MDSVRFLTMTTDRKVRNKCLRVNLVEAASKMDYHLLLLKINISIMQPMTRDIDKGSRDVVSRVSVCTSRVKIGVDRGSLICYEAHDAPLTGSCFFLSVFFSGRSLN
jgi:hypothetical protein